MLSDSVMSYKSAPTMWERWSRALMIHLIISQGFLIDVRHSLADVTAALILHSVRLRHYMVESFFTVIPLSVSPSFLLLLNNTDSRF